MPDDDQRHALAFVDAGLGHWGPNLDGGFGDDPAVEVRWMCDLDPDRRARHPDAGPTILEAADNRKPRTIDTARLAEPISVEHALVP